MHLKSFKLVDWLVNSKLHLKLFFIVLQMNTHLTPRPILLTRHGESRDNVRGRIGGDSLLRCVTIPTFIGSLAAACDVLCCCSLIVIIVLLILEPAFIFFLIFHYKACLYLTIYREKKEALM